MSFAFLYPFLLLSLPIAFAGLVYIYLKQGNLKRKVISSVFLLAKIRALSNAKRKFVPPIRFFFELFLLTLLLLGGAGIMKKDVVPKVAILIDNSFSMFSKELETNRKLIEVAKEKALQSIKELDGELSVWITTPRLLEISKDEADLDSKIEGKYADDSLGDSIGELLSKDYEKLYVFTDKKGESNERVEVRSLRKTINNVGVISALLASNKASFKVMNFSSEHFKGRSYIQGVDYKGETQELGGVEIDLPAMIKKDVVFNIEDRRYPGYVLGVRPTIFTQNSIEEDDKAFLVQTQDKKEVLIVSSVNELGLGEIPFAKFKIFDGNLEDAIKERDKFFLFHKETPDALPAGNSLFILPQSGIGFDLLGNLSSKVTSWKIDHPLLQYINMQTFVNSRARAYKAPVWAENVISSDEGAIMLAGESGGSRYVVMGFEVLPFEGNGSPLLSVLTLNVFKWLYGEEVDGGYSPLYSKIKLKEGEKLFYHTAGSWSELESSDSAPFLVRKPGLYMVDSIKDPKMVAVNYFSEDESNTYDQRDVTFKKDSARKVERVESENSIVHILAMFCVAMLVIDMLWMVIRA